MTPTSTNRPRLLAQFMRGAIAELGRSLTVETETEGAEVFDNALASLREIADQLEALPEAWSEDTALLDLQGEQKWDVDHNPEWGWAAWDEDRWAYSDQHDSPRAALRAARDAATRSNTGG